MTPPAVRYAVITASDRAARGERPDASGPVAVARLGEILGSEPLEVLVLPDDRARLEEELIRLCDEVGCRLVVTTGGTGLAPRDVTPDATRAVIDREVPGLAEAIRAEGRSATPRAMLSRAVCGQRGRALIVNLSGSPRAVEEQLDVLRPVLLHALEVAGGGTTDCGR